jgi:DNA-binding transcriptional LysR family regulator
MLHAILLITLLENKIDIAIAEDNLNPKPNYTALFKDQFVAVVPLSHSGAQGGELICFSNYEERH